MALAESGLDLAHSVEDLLKWDVQIGTQVTIKSIAFDLLGLIASCFRSEVALLSCVRFPGIFFRENSL